MNLNYGIYQPLRFLENIKHQTRFQPGANFKVFELLCPSNYLLPFQIRRPATPLPVQVFKLVSITDGSEIDLSALIATEDMQVYNFSTFDVITYFGSLELPENASGEHYVELSDGINTWYSEVITFKAFSPELDDGSCVLTKITYWDTCDTGGIFYRTVAQGDIQYKNVVYLDTGIGKPEYDYNEEGDEDGEGTFTPEYKRLEKQYALQGVYPEFFTDALSIIPLHVSGDDSKGVVEVLTNKGYTGKIDTFAVDPDWQGAKGLYAKTDIIFSTDFIVKVGCCDAQDAVLTTCLRNYTDVVARIVDTFEDYDNFEYTSASDGSKIPLLDGEVILRLGSDGINRLESYDDSLPGYVAVDSSNIDSIRDVNYFNGGVPQSQVYFYNNGVSFEQLPEITFEGQQTPGEAQRIVQGNSHENTLIEVYAYNENGSELIKVGLSSDFNQGGIVYNIPALTQGIYVINRGLNCSLGQSANFEYEDGGVGIGAIGSSFRVG